MPIINRPFELSSDLILLLSLLFNISEISASDRKRPSPGGIILGRIFDVDTQAPLAGASIAIIGTNDGMMADSAGQYILNNIPSGNHSLRFSYIGYASVIRGDIEVRSGRTTRINSALNMISIRGRSIKVNSGYFPLNERQPVSAASFTAVSRRLMSG
nr:carboxypeptidase-like regulatory domain-containing protein [candidate division Zixibacteria bacterium]